MAPTAPITKASARRRDSAAERDHGHARTMETFRPLTRDLQVERAAASDLDAERDWRHAETTLTNGRLDGSLQVERAKRATLTLGPWRGRKPKPLTSKPPSDRLPPSSCLSSPSRARQCSAECSS